MKKYKSLLLAILVTCLYSCHKSPSANKTQSQACFTTDKDSVIVLDTLRLSICVHTFDSVLYSFGDGSTSRDSTPFHIYSGTGTYIINQIVFIGGSSSNTSKSVMVIGGLANGARRVYYRLGSSYDSVLCRGNGNLYGFGFQAYDIVACGIGLDAQFTSHDSFTYDFNAAGIVLTGTGHFSNNDSIIHLNWAGRIDQPNSTPPFINISDTFTGLRR